MSDWSGCMRFSAPWSDDVELTRDELIWINNALNEVLNGPDAINEREFSTRMGGGRDEIKSLLSRLHEEVGRTR
jgi:hypothetical protein